MEDVFLGTECEQALSRIPLPDNPSGRQSKAELEAQRSKDLKQFRINCLNFYVTAAQEMRHWLPSRKGIYKEIEFVDPQKALSHEVRAQEIKDLPELCATFKVCSH